MRKNISLLISSCLIFILASCAGENDCNEGGGKISFSYSIEEMNAQTTTRVVVEPQVGETVVEEIYLFFFNASDDASGTLVDVVVPSSEVLNMEQSYILSGNVNAATAYHVLAVANISAYLSGQDVETWAQSFSGTTEEYFRNNALATVTGVSVDNTYDTANAIRQAALPMFGFVKKSAGSQSVQVTLQRIVARLDVLNNISSETYGTYTIASASVWNAYSQASITGDVLMDFSADTGNRLKRFYGISNDAAVTSGVEGGLYAFPNYSASPSQNDKLTTCVIVGLLNPDSEVRYYRINIDQSSSVQQLRGNNVYRTTIVGVAGEGYSTETEAYEGTTNQLLYLSNEWNLDDNGLIVTDENSLLAIPVKTVSIGASGGELSYSITTYSTLENPSPLGIKSQSWDPDDGNIYAVIQNGQLVITAASMSANETQRSGIITITYAGLETTVNVLQSASADKYLNVTVDEEWVNTLPPTANGSSEFVFVDASGPWTVTMYGSENFAFKSPLGLYTNTLTSDDLNIWRFRIYTQYENISTTDMPKGFALISLDEDPENYVAVVTVYQATTGSISTDVDVSGGINFYGSTYVNDGTTSLTNQTSYSFTVTASGTISSNTVRVLGQNANKFTATYSNGTVTVSAVETNTSGANYTATLAIADSSNGYLYVPLTQSSITVTATADNTAFTADGGAMTITVDSNDPYVSWAVSGSIGAVASDETVYLHNLSYTDADDVTLVDGDLTTSTTIKVNIPKVYYPNRDIDIEGSVTFRVNMLTNTEIINFTQSALTARTIDVWQQRTGYGAIGNTYFTAYSSALYSKIGTTTIPTTYSTSRNYTHGNSAAVTLSLLATELGFYNNNDGVMVYACDSPGYATILNDTTYSPLGVNGFVTTGSSGITAPSFNTNNSVSNTKIYKFITQYTTTFTPSSLTSMTGLDATHTELTAWPSTGVPLIMSANTAANALFVIDPASRICYLGEGALFNVLTTGSTQYTFMNNFIQYVVYTAQYGSHFSDLLIGNDQDENDPLPAPWDDRWGENKQTDFSN